MNQPANDTRKIGPYAVRALIGRGPDTTVVLAHDPAKDAPVAVKLLPKAVLQTPTVQQQWQDWVQAMTAVPPPHVVPIQDSGTAGGHPFVVMPAWRERSLARLLRNGPLPLPQANDVLLALTAALVALHDEPWTHGNLTPANIFVHGNQVWLSDVGLRPVLAQLDGVAAGTPGYLSPEQIEGRAPTPRSDFYALGVVLYEMLSGAPAYTGETAAAVTLRQMSGPVPDVRAQNDALPPRYNGLIQRLTAPDPADRPQSAEMVQELVTAVVHPDATPVSVDEDVFQRMTQYHKKESTLAEREEEIRQIHSLKTQETQSSEKRMAELMAIEAERQKILQAKLEKQRQKERKIMIVAAVMLTTFILMVAAYFLLRALAG